jgi:hypothetical protein
MLMFMSKIRMEDNHLCGLQVQVQTLRLIAFCGFADFATLFHSIAVSFICKVEISVKSKIEAR